jgi:hypothetical protein
MQIFNLGQCEIDIWEGAYTRIVSCSTRIRQCRTQSTSCSSFSENNLYFLEDLFPFFSFCPVGGDFVTLW